MVAESVTQKTRSQESLVKAAEHLLVRIKLDDQGVPANFADWDTGVQKWVGAMDITWVVDPDGNVQVPADQLVRVLAHSNAARVLQSRAGVVKIEEPGYKSEQKKESDVRTDLLRAIAKRTAGLKAESKVGTASGIDKTVYFVDTEIACTEEESRQLEDGGYVFAEVFLSAQKFTGRSWYCPVESKAKRDDRFFVWRELECTLSALKKNLWEHIPLGNSCALIKFIRDRFGRDRSEQQSNKWHLSLDSLRIDNKKGFDIFFAEVTKLLDDAKVLGINYDGTNIRNKVKKAIFSGGNSTLQDEWVNAARVEARASKAGPDLPKWSVPDILEEMRAGVMATGNSQKEIAPSVASGSGGSDNLLREVDELKKQIKRLQFSKGETGASSGSKPSWLGVCGFFQEGTCTKPSCPFKHTPLNDEDKAKLREYIKKKATTKTTGAAGANSGFTGKCFKCGKEGHRANKCPAKTSGNIKKTMADWMKRNDFSELLQEAKQELDGLDQE